MNAMIDPMSADSVDGNTIAQDITAVAGAAVAGAAVYKTVTGPQVLPVGYQYNPLTNTATFSPFSNTSIWIIALVVVALIALHKP